MKALVCLNTKLSVQELPEPVPAKRQVLVEVLRCGICGPCLRCARHPGTARQDSDRPEESGQKAGAHGVLSSVAIQRMPLG